MSPGVTESVIVCPACLQRPTYPSSLQGPSGQFTSCPCWRLQWSGSRWRFKAETIRTAKSSGEAYLFPDTGEFIMSSPSCSSRRIVGGSPSGQARQAHVAELCEFARQEYLAESVLQS